MHTQPFLWFTDLDFRKSSNTYCTFFPYKYSYNSSLCKLKKCFKKRTFRAVLRQGCAVFCGNLRICGLFNHKICGIAICGLAHLRILRICDRGMGQRICDLLTLKKFACPPLTITYDTLSLVFTAEHFPVTVQYSTYNTCIMYSISTLSPSCQYNRASFGIRSYTGCRLPGQYGLLAWFLPTLTR
jgi:hypothetical protein